MAKEEKDPETRSLPRRLQRKMELRSRKICCCPGFFIALATPSRTEVELVWRLNVPRDNGEGQREQRQCYNGGAITIAVLFDGKLIFLQKWGSNWGAS